MDWHFVAHFKTNGLLFSVVVRSTRIQKLTWTNANSEFDHKADHNTPVQCMFRILFTTLFVLSLQHIGMEGSERKAHTNDNETEDAMPLPKPPNNRA